MWSDNETKEDLLGYQVHASLLKDVILDSSMLPTSIGIFGNWGAGKSSLMLLLQNELEEWVEQTQKKNEGKKDGQKENNLILQIPFNSWKFENYENTKNTLIVEILEAISSDIASRKDVFEKADDLIKRISLLRVGLFLLKKGAQFFLSTEGLPQEISNLIPSVDELKGFLKKEDAEALVKDLKEKNAERFISKFRELFEALVLSAGYRAVVVYIDDLDRCNPTKVVDCLEAIKLFVFIEIISSYSSNISLDTQRVYSPFCKAPHTLKYGLRLDKEANRQLVSRTILITAVYKEYANALQVRHHSFPETILRYPIEHPYHHSLSWRNKETKLF